MIDAGGWARASCMSVLHIAGQDQYCDKPRHSLVWRAMIGSEHGGISAGRCCHGTQCCRIMDTAEMTISGTPLIPNQDGGLVSVVGEQSDMESLARGEHLLQHAHQRTILEGSGDPLLVSELLIDLLISAVGALFYADIDAKAWG